MSYPTSMKTGIGSFIYESVYPETFYVIYLILGAILRRCSYKDSNIYVEHNSEILEQEFLDTGVVFNLFSNYGVGKGLEPLIRDLFSNLTLDPDKYQNDVFFQEIVKLAAKASKVVREHNISKESSWVTEYMVDNLNSLDGITINREIRLYPLFNIKSDIEIESDDSDEVNDEICDCNFCEEFRHYHYPYNRNVNEIITNVLSTIAKETINNTSTNSQFC